MISDFERRLADLLSARLPAPFTGRVDVAPGNLPGNGPALLLGVTRVSPGDPGLGNSRPVVVPGANDPRRVLRLACTVAVEVRPGPPNQGRNQQMRGLEALLYALDAPDLRNGQALASGAPPDPGFFIHSLRINEGLVALSPNDAGAEPVAATAHVEGWFWPIGTVGETGIPIATIRLRGASLPLALSPANPRLLAGGAPVELTIRIGAGSFGTTTLPGPAALPFGNLAFMVVDAGGRPGKGNLLDAVDGLRLVPLVDQAATVRYQPPAEPANDQLLIMLDDGAGGAGIELARVPLNSA